MSSSPERFGRPKDPTGDLGVVDTSGSANSPRGRVVTLVVAVAIAVCANLLLVSSGLWRWVDSTGAPSYAAYDPVALELPSNMAAPEWVRNGTVLLGSSTVGMSLPTEKTEQRIGRRAWTVWASGLRPVEFLALAPRIADAEPADVLIALEARMAVLDGETPFSEQNRRAYVGPFNPAWKYHKRMSDLGWAGRWGTLPALRLRPALRVLIDGYLSGAIIAKRLPDPPVWKQGENGFHNEQAQATLAVYRATPTVENYNAYLDALGTVHEGIREFWTQMRQAEPDPQGTGDNLRALHETTRYLHARGIRVSWFLFPENPVCQRIIADNGRPMGPPELRPIAQRVFADAAQREGVTYYDLLDMAGADEFIDFTHLTPPASERLGEALRQMFVELDA